MSGKGYYSTLQSSLKRFDIKKFDIKRLVIENFQVIWYDFLSYSIKIKERFNLMFY